MDNCECARKQHRHSAPRTNYSREIIGIREGQHRRTGAKNFSAGTTIVALRAENAVARGRQCRIIFAAEKPTRRVAGVVCRIRERGWPDPPAADWRPPLLEI